MRDAYLDPALLAEVQGRIRLDGTLGPLDTLLYGRAIMPSLAPTVAQRSADATFEWVKEPSEDMPCGTTYMDGSLLHNDRNLAGLAARNGWAMATFSPNGDLLAAAHGVPPH